MGSTSEWLLVCSEENYPRISYKVFQDDKEVRIVISSDKELMGVSFKLRFSGCSITSTCVLCKGKKFKWVVISLFDGEQKALALFKVKRNSNIELLDRVDWSTLKELCRYDYNEFGDNIIRCLPLGVEPKVFR